MHQKMLCYCAYCDEHFDNEEDCRRHEKEVHCHDHSVWTNKKIAEELRVLANSVWTYETDETAMGRPCNDLIDFFEEAAKRIERAGEEEPLLQKKLLGQNAENKGEN